MMEKFLPQAKRWLTNNWILASLTAGAIITRLPDLAYPRAVVFDEVYFLHDFASAYFSRQYYFDIHPPLGKLLIAAWLWITHVGNTSTVAAAPWVARLLLTLFGIAIVPLVYGVTKQLTRSKITAGLAGLLILFNGAFVAYSRLVLMDSMLICFGLASLYSILRWRNRQIIGWLIAAGLAAGACASIKWTGLTMLPLIFLIIVYYSEKKRIRFLPIGSYPIGRKMIARLLLVVLLAAFVYVGSFWIHLALLTRSGQGDAFMTPKFQQTLIGNPAFDPDARMPFWQKFIELNHEMYHANATLDATAPYGSKWYTWPVEARPVYLWQGTTFSDGTQGNMYLLSNPITWWLSSLSVLATIAILFIPKLRTVYKTSILPLSFLLIAYFLNWLPFARIARVMFLYHYLFSMLFATIMLAILITNLPGQKKYRKYAIEGLVAITVIGFIYYSPLTYGIPISPAHLHALTILPGWR